jgi:GntR family transcriptional regulator
MKIRIDPSSPIPLYCQIRDQLRDQILAGAFQTGEMLPTEQQISAQTGVSRMTVRQALAQLASEGWVERQRGRGTFVADRKKIPTELQYIGLNYTQFIRRAGLAPATRVLRQEIQPAPQEVADWLQIPPGEATVFIFRLRLIADEPVAVERLHLPHHRVPGLEQIDLNNRSLHQTLHEHYALVPDHARDVVEISIAEPYEAGLLQVAECTPVARVLSLDFLADQTPLILNQVTHRSDRFRLILHRSRQADGEISPF